MYQLRWLSSSSSSSSSGAAAWVRHIWSMFICTTNLPPSLPSSIWHRHVRASLSRPRSRSPALSLLAGLAGARLAAVIPLPFDALRRAALPLHLYLFVRLSFRLGVCGLPSSKVLGGRSTNFGRNYLLPFRNARCCSLMRLNFTKKHLQYDEYDMLFAWLSDVFRPVKKYSGCVQSRESCTFVL